MPTLLPSRLTTVILCSALGFVLACSKVTAENQCATDDQCSALLHVRPGTAICSGGICIPRCHDCGGEWAPPYEPPDVCESTERCLAEHPGEKWVCQEPGRQSCVRLTSPECTEVHGDWERMVPRARPLIVGAIMPLDSKNADGTVSPSAFDLSERDAMELARSEWQRAVGGLSMGETARQPFVLVICDSRGESGRVTSALSHLKSIGASSVVLRSDDDASAAAPLLGKLQIPAVCTHCVSEPSLQSDAAGFLYRLAPAYGSSIVPLVTRWVRDTETRIRAEGGPIVGQNVRAVYVSPKDPQSELLEREIVEKLELNGAPVPQPSSDFQYFQVAANIADITAAIPTLVSQKPDIILLAGGVELLVQYIPRIEAAWSPSDRKPRYMLLDPSIDPAAVALAVKDDEGLRRRITGFSAYDPKGFEGRYEAFKGRFAEKFQKQPILGTAYDAFYLLTEATTAALGDPRTAMETFGGHDVARQVPFVTNRDSSLIVEADPKSIPRTRELLAGHVSIQARGVFSDFAFDHPKRTQTSDAVVYCPAVNGQGAFGLQPAMVYRREKKDVEAPFDDSLCGW
ncbi:MAG: ABC transporter substrate-binding protein [Polyangiaceae bacterium]